MVLVVKWSQPESLRQAISAVNGRDTEGGLVKLFVIYKIMDESQTLDNAFIYCWKMA